MDDDPPPIDGALVRHLVSTQFARWAQLAIRPVENGGWCNRVFHLGEEMIVRLPRHRAYAEQTAKEYRWLPRLAPLLPLAIPEPLAIGEPAAGLPWQWSIYRWIEGDPALPERIADRAVFAADLGGFLGAMQRLDTMQGPPPGPHNFHRGGLLATYDAQTRQAIAALAGKVDTGAVVDVWEAALSAAWTAAPVWVHGDVGVGNLLVRDGRLCAVIDFGNLAVGDPACDLAPAWTVFDGPSREAFRATLALDAATWARGRGWVLWKALIIAAGLTSSNAFADSRPWRVLEEVLADHRRAQA